MNRRIYKNFSLLLCMLLLAGIVIHPASAYAAQQSTLSVTIPVKQHFTVPLNASVEYRLTSKTAGEPMPQGTGEDGCHFSITGDGTDDFEITYHETGIYTYEISQVSGGSDGTYTNDTEVYTVELFVKNKGEDALTYDIILMDHAGEKVKDISFVCQTAVQETTAVKTGDSADGMFYIGAAAASFVLFIRLSQMKIYKRNK